LHRGSDAPTEPGGSKQAGFFASKVFDGAPRRVREAPALF
jgi:hypothetical protein